MSKNFIASRSKDGTSFSAKVERNNNENSHEFRISKSIVDNDRGSINVYSEAGSNTEAKIGIEGISK